MAELLNREEHERSLTDCLKRTLGSREQRFVDQLGTPPDINNIEPSLWNDIAFELRACTEEILLAMFLASATQHLVDNIIINISREQARKRTEEIAKVWAGRRANELSQLLVRNSQRILARNNGQWVKQLEAGNRLTKSNGQAAARQIFGRNRIRVIAITETTNTIASGGEIAMNEAGLTHPHDLWFNHPELTATGPCPICIPLHRVTRAIWSVKFPFGPPAHTHCVCEIVYWNSVRRIEAANPDLASVFIGTPGGDVIAPLDRGTRPFQMGL